LANAVYALLQHSSYFTTRKTPAATAV